MASNVASNDSDFNTHDNIFIRLTTRINNLPILHRRLLQIYYEDRCDGIAESDRSLKELSRRLGRHKNNISCALADLEEGGLLKSKPHGSRFKKRWITCDAFCKLDSQPRTQTRTQIKPIPYMISYSEKEEETLKILEEAQICEQVEECQPIEPVKPIGLVMEPIMTTALFQSPLSQERKKELMARVAAAMKENFVESKRAYFLKALQREEKFIYTT